MKANKGNKFWDFGYCPLNRRCPLNTGFTVLFLTSFDLSMLFALLLLLMIASLDCSLLLSLLMLCTAELSLFPLLVILNSSEFAIRELNSWLLVKQILTTELGTKLLLLSDEPLCFCALLEVFQMDPSSTELPAGSKSHRID